MILLQLCSMHATLTAKVFKMKISKAKLRQIIKEELHEARYSRPDATEQDIRDAEEVLVELAEQYPGLIAQFDKEQILQGLIWWSSNIGGGKHWTKWQPALLNVLEELSSGSLNEGADRVHWRESRNKETGKTLEEMLQWLSQWATSLEAHHADTPEDKERLRLVHLTIEEAAALLK